jgi:thiol:disulfide interchange protein DsbD
MKHLLASGLFMIACLFACTANAQISDPSHWTFAAKRISPTEVEITAQVKLDGNWHVWSLEPGGDGTLIAPSFEFEKGTAVMGKPGETGTRQSMKLEFLEEGKQQVYYFEHEVTFSQKIKAKGGTTVKGEVEYQLCNDQMCLPPRSRQFDLKL